ncbi:hypothetical protein NDU88_002999 [Pleurodeles waltl]|uniref:Uncharacterized protein n=1 Tax=Pleurodeles waltl TaxID=8319 RepID=A0AAV7W657_PLEWA|nr:hypothetical protein NDU88_002999 [Pleurodeles waltl]
MLGRRAPIWDGAGTAISKMPGIWEDLTEPCTISWKGDMEDYRLEKGRIFSWGGGRSCGAVGQWGSGRDAISLCVVGKPYNGYRQLRYFVGNIRVAL